MPHKVKVYISCFKGNLFLLRSCVASIRYWNKTVSIVLLKDLSKGSFDTSELEKVFNVTLALTKYNQLGYFIKLQPFIEHPDERIFLQDGDMVWLGDMMPLLNGIHEHVAIQAYEPVNTEAELNKWYFNTEKLKKYYPEYKYPGFVFNGGTILFDSHAFNQSDFEDIILWKEKTIPIHEDVFFCEDQSVLNYVFAKKYFNNSISIAKINLQISCATEEAKRYKLSRIKNFEPLNIIVHWLGKKNGLTSFYTASHLIRFFEKEYYSHCKNGPLKMLFNRFLRTIKNIDKFIYELAKKIYYIFIPNSHESI